MIRGKVWSNDGELVFIDNAFELADLVERKIGYDAAELVRLLIGLADDTKQRLDSDLLAYKSQLESQRDAFCKINDYVVHLLNFVQQAKITKKTKEFMLKSLEAIQKEISNQI